MTVSKAKKNTLFLFSELVKRDFKKKYKGAYLGVLWSLISPLLTLLVMSVIFTHFFGRTTPHYTIYLFAGNIVFSFFSDATGGGMGSFLGNAEIFTKINVPKHLFLLSRNVSSFINFFITLMVFFVFCVFDGITPDILYLLLLVPILCLCAFNVGVGLILASLLVFFRDMQYLWSVFTMLLMYMSAIFYTTDILPEKLRSLFLLNPIYVYISCLRDIVISNTPPSSTLILAALGYASAALIIGAAIYKKCNKSFAYYV